MPNSLPEHIDAAVRDRGPQPFLTFYEPGSDARTELSYATFDNWASKAANWLVEEHGLDRGDVIEVAVRDDWRTVVLAGACWKAGVGAGFAVAGATAGDEVLVFADDYDDPDVDGHEPAVRSGDRAWTQNELVGEAPELPGRARVATALPAASPDLWRLTVGILLARGALVWTPGADDADAVRRRAQSERAGYLFEGGGLTEL